MVNDRNINKKTYNKFYFLSYHNFKDSNTGVT